ncbi:BatD family protein [Halochromatium roseum]|uniref:BatD family protein n=1 Tax=Halochromatium roseum TaxID=391920 RepID=UPI00191357A2|nr:BatD family protein [Halochromatium roseum]
MKGLMPGFMLVLLLLLLPGLGLAAEVRAFLNQSQVYEGDRVLLTIEGTGRSLGQEPDLTALNADFEVGGTSTSQQTQFVNGRRSDKTSWQVVLMPKRLGRLRIPPLAVGSATTEPLTLVVEAVPEGGLGAPGDLVWLEVELGSDPVGDVPSGSPEVASSGSGLNDGGPNQPKNRVADKLVVQQQVPLVVRAYSARPLLDYAIDLPPIEGAVLTRIGRDQGSLTMRAGEQYRVIERRYTLSPERSGTLRIPPITFDAELKTDAGRRPGSLGMSGLPDLFDDPMLERMLGGMRLGAPGSMFERGEPARAQSEALTLEVAPSAEGFSGEHWLPATALEVDDSWRPADGGKTPRLAVGEPATRILTLTARGLAGNQIPEIEIPVPPGFRVYPGQTESETRSDGENLIGMSRQQLTLIPTTAGELELPRIEVPWWDTASGQERTATVPALALSVSGAAAGAASEAAGRAALDRLEAEDAPGAARLGTGAEHADEHADERADERADAGQGAEASAGTGRWRWSFGKLLVLAVAVVVAGGVMYRVWRRRSSTRRALPGEQQGQRDVTPSAEARRARDALRSACERDDAPAAAAALLAWAGALWPDDPPSGLGALAERAERGRAQIQALERHLYAAAQSQPAWRGEVLWSAVRAGLKGAAMHAREQGDDQLAPLYP